MITLQKYGKLQAEVICLQTFFTWRPETHFLSKAISVSKSVSVDKQN